MLAALSRETEARLASALSVAPFPFGRTFLSPRDRTLLPAPPVSSRNGTVRQPALVFCCSGSPHRRSLVATTRVHKRPRVLAPRRLALANAAATCRLSRYQRDCCVRPRPTRGSSEGRGGGHNTVVQKTMMRCVSAGSAVSSRKPQEPMTAGATQARGQDGAAARMSPCARRATEADRRRAVLHNWRRGRLCGVQARATGHVRGHAWNVLYRTAVVAGPPPNCFARILLQYGTVLSPACPSSLQG